MRLTQIIEALLFASDAPLTAEDLARIDDRLDEDTVAAVIDELRTEYDLGERSFQVYDVAGGYQILTRPEFVAVLERYDTVPQSSRLSTPALEVLAIIAYRQPLGRSEIEEIRGVQSAAVLRTLLDRGLIDAVGRSEGLGRPLLYGTTPKFLEHFGFRSLEDLPRPDELPVILRSRPVEAAAEPGAAEEGAATTAEPAPAEGDVAAEAVSAEGAGVASSEDEAPAIAAEVAAESVGEVATSDEDAASVAEALAEVGDSGPEASASAGDEAGEPEEHDDASDIAREAAIAQSSSHEGDEAGIESVEATPGEDEADRSADEGDEERTSSGGDEREALGARER